MAAGPFRERRTDEPFPLGADDEIGGPAAPGGGEARLAMLRSLLSGAQEWARISADSLARHVRLSQLASLRMPAPGHQLHPVEAARRLESLVYELLDAHQETARLAVDLEWDPEWSDHLAYLRQLQRVSREVLSAASVAVGPLSNRVP